MTLSAGNIDVLLKSPDKASTMHLSRRQSDGTWNVKMRRAVIAAASPQEDVKPLMRRSLFPVPARWESFLSLLFTLLERGFTWAVIALGFIMIFHSATYKQEGGRFCVSSTLVYSSSVRRNQEL